MVAVGDVETGGGVGAPGVAAAGEGVAGAAPWTGVDAKSVRLAAITPNTGATRHEQGPRHRMPA
jgi:hypothetical protein